MYVASELLRATMYPVFMHTYTYFSDVSSLVITIISKLLGGMSSTKRFVGFLPALF